MLVHHISCKLLDRLWERRREEQGLAVWSDLIDNGAELILESQVKHAVGLVDDEVCAALCQGEGTLTQEFNQLARR